MTAHPVGDDEQLEVLVDEEAVLVVVALLAHIGQPTGDDSQPDRGWLGRGHADRRWYRRPSGTGKETATSGVPTARDLGGSGDAVRSLTPPVARARPGGRRASPTRGRHGATPRRRRVLPM